jgi:hypothetical protein
MVDLTRKLRPFIEVGGSNSRNGSDGKSRDNKDREKESCKNSRKIILDLIP